MKSTRKQRTSRRKTYRQKGGREWCPTDTEEDQQIVNEWRSVSRILKTRYDANYGTEYHVLQNPPRTCNLWVWKQCESRQAASENHLDVFWRDRDRLQLGIKATRNGRNAGTNNVNLSYARGYSQESFCQEIAAAINQTYNNLLRCAKYDITWAETGIELLRLDDRFVYNFDCNEMSYSNDDIDNYYVVANWRDFSRFQLGFKFYSYGRQIGSDSEYIDSDDFCNSSFYKRMAKLFRRKFNEYMPN